VRLRALSGGEPLQVAQLAGDLVASGEIRLQVGLVGGQDVAALTGLGVLQQREQSIGVSQEFVGSLARGDGQASLLEDPERRHHDERGQRDRSREEGEGPESGFRGQLNLLREETPLATNLC